MHLTPETPKYALLVLTLSINGRLHGYFVSSHVHMRRHAESLRYFELYGPEWVTCLALNTLPQCLTIHIVLSKSTGTLASASFPFTRLTTLAALADIAWCLAK